MARKSVQDTYIGQLFSEGIYVPTRTVRLDTEIDEDSAAKVLKGLHILGSISEEQPITVVLNSNGGEVDHGLAIYDAIRELPNEVTVRVYGRCYSMAAWILQAADVRVMSPNSVLMIHSGSWGIEGHAESALNWAQFEKQVITPRCEDILLIRIRERHPNFTYARLRKMLVADTILTAEQALELGLIDKIGN